MFARQRRYPKTTIAAASATDPAGSGNIQSAFKWADLYMTRLANRFGSKWLSQRLKVWRWTFSSAFSGVGAPESAPNLVDQCFIKLIFRPCPISNASQHIACEALASLEKAAKDFLISAGAPTPTHAKVLYEFTCENDRHCRKVLKNTYNMPCNWPDVTSFNSRKKMQYCSTHNCMCLVQKFRRGNRISVSLYIAVKSCKHAISESSAISDKLAAPRIESQWIWLQPRHRNIVVLP